MGATQWKEQAAWTSQNAVHVLLYPDSRAPLPLLQQRDNLTLVVAQRHKREIRGEVDSQSLLHPILSQ
jgi:hypothetical protein